MGLWAGSGSVQVLAGNQAMHSVEVPLQLLVNILVKASMVAQTHSRLERQVRAYVVRSSNSNWSDAADALERSGRAGSCGWLTDSTFLVEWTPIRRAARCGARRCVRS